MTFLSDPFSFVTGGWPSTVTLRFGLRATTDINSSSMWEYKKAWQQGVRLLINAEN